jgi:hypothetical protein
MSTEALVYMIAIESVITALTAYFFIRILTTKPRPEPDSYTEE